jgi:hypothetical protein
MTHLFSSERPEVSTRRTAIGLFLIALSSILPLVLQSGPLSFKEPYSSRILTITAEVGVAVLLLLIAVWGPRIDLVREKAEGYGDTLLFIALAGLMTLAHWLEVDRDEVRLAWQRDLYLGVFDHTATAPHRYRPLPYGIARLLECITRDWWFACTAYRWFFNFWFVWASYRLARLFFGRTRALATLLPLLLLYPFSIVYYYGQLTDPLSHTLFVLSFAYVLQDRPLALAASLALGVLAKETAVIVVPAYLACYWREGLRSLLITAGLGLACIAAFLAARLPLGWWPGYGDINGTDGLMIGTNLGFGEPIALTAVPLYQNYLHPLLFIGPFLPFIVWRWERIDLRLRSLALTVTPLLLLSNVCFGWLYESRNYMPLVPLLAIMALWEGEKLKVP